VELVARPAPGRPRGRDIVRLFGSVGRWVGPGVIGRGPRHVVLDTPGCGKVLTLTTSPGRCMWWLGGDMRIGGPPWSWRRSRSRTSSTRCSCSAGSPWSSCGLSSPTRTRRTVSGERLDDTTGSAPHGIARVTSYIHPQSSAKPERRGRPAGSRAHFPQLLPRAAFHGVGAPQPARLLLARHNPA
jgi:hypothetical protein